MKNRFSEAYPKLLFCLLLCAMRLSAQLVDVDTVYTRDWYYSELDREVKVTNTSEDTLFIDSVALTADTSVYLYDSYALEIKSAESRGGYPAGWGDIVGHPGDWDRNWSPRKVCANDSIFFGEFFIDYCFCLVKRTAAMRIGDTISLGVTLHSSHGPIVFTVIGKMNATGVQQTIAASRGNATPRVPRIRFLANGRAVQPNPARGSANARRIQGGKPNERALFSNHILFSIFPE